MPKVKVGRGRHAVEIDDFKPHDYDDKWLKDAHARRKYPVWFDREMGWERNNLFLRAREGAADWYFRDSKMRPYRRRFDSLYSDILQGPAIPAVDALADVLMIHYPAREGVLDGPACRTCQNYLDLPEPWPCPTFLAIEARRGEMPSDPNVTLEEFRYRREAERARRLFPNESTLGDQDHDGLDDHPVVEDVPG